ncbi:MAG: NAD(P)-dependent oxidoreductase [Bacteroidota bacterium]|nr:NAD(P)-dependent oxidoreductase [Bacteroidota bacterium]
MKKILIIDAMHDSLVPALEELGYLVDYEPDITKEGVFSVIENYDGLIVRSKVFIDEHILNKAIKLKFIGRAGAGIDQIVEDEIIKRNIKLVNAPEGNRDSVAEHAMGMLLSLLNKMSASDAEIRQGIWNREENRGYELGGKTVGIIGYGNTGKAFAKRLQSFGCRVLAYDQNKKYFTDSFAAEATMDEIYDNSDIVSFHIPLTDETNEMVDYQYINNFRKKIWIINTARGKILKINDLINQIENGKVIGAALDVLEYEPIEVMKKNDPDLYQRVISNYKLLLTPHIAGWSYESYQRINDVLVNKIKALGI